MAKGEVIRTKRLILRPLTPADADPVTKGISDWEVIRWLSSPPWPYSLPDAEWFIDNAAGDHSAITRANAVIGVVSVQPDLGYWLARGHHRQGLMTEAAQAVVSHHFAQSDAPLTSGHFPGNAASAAVLGKLGFVYTAPRRVFARSLGHDVEVQRMELTAARWHQTAIEFPGGRA